LAARAAALWHLAAVPHDVSLVTGKASHRQHAPQPHDDAPSRDDDCQIFALAGQAPLKPAATVLVAQAEASDVVMPPMRAAPYLRGWALYRLAPSCSPPAHA
jgi:hypothetical protein